MNQQFIVLDLGVLLDGELSMTSLLQALVWPLWSSLNCCASYLEPHTQLVHFDSECLELWGLHSSRLLGPLLFTLLTTPLGSLSNANSLHYHFYLNITHLLHAYIACLILLSNYKLLFLVRLSLVWPVANFSWIAPPRHKLTTTQIWIADICSLMFIETGCSLSSEFSLKSVL